MRFINRREFMQVSAGASASSLIAGGARKAEEEQIHPKRGTQRLSLPELKAWEALRYGLCVHFCINTFTNVEWGDGKTPVSTYNPDKLDVDSWVQTARDAGMKYVVLTAKHVAGFCLWPSRLTDYTVANSGNKTDVVERFVKACEKHGILPGLYYSSLDNHNRFGSYTIDDAFKSLKPAAALRAAYTTSHYQTFQTAQITELLTQYGSICEMWIDIPHVLGRGYRTFLYEHIARLQPKCLVNMNLGHDEADASGEVIFNHDADEIHRLTQRVVTWAWPSDIVFFEQCLPSGSGNSRWFQIEGKTYYIPGEAGYVLSAKGNWFHEDGELYRPDAELVGLFTKCRERKVNFLLDVGPDKHGLIPKPAQDALMRLRRNVGL